MDLPELLPDEMNQKQPIRAKSWGFLLSIILMYALLNVIMVEKQPTVTENTVSAMLTSIHDRLC